MPIISIRGNEMPASPIRKLAPLADAAKQRGIHVYHLNIGQPDLPTPRAALDAIRNIDRTVLEYSPSQGYRSYREKLVGYYKKYDINLSADDIIITTGGSEAVLFAFLSCLNPGDEIIVPEPAYANYMAFAISAGAVIRTVTTTIEEGFSLPKVEKFEELINERTRAILICNPNNPTGMLIPHRLLKKILEKCRKLEILLVVDECFLDFVKEPQEYSLKRSLSGFNNLFILKAFTKRYAMAGVRLGYGLCSNRKLLEKMELCVQPWNVSTMAQAAGIQALEETEYVEKGRQLVFQEAQWLKEEMTRIGYQVFPSEANYIFFKGPEELFDFCLRKRILIRDCSNYPGLKKGYYRVAVKRHEENIRLIEVLEGGILWQKQ